MVSPQIALLLKRAGLVWQPKMHDTFALLERDMDGHVFALNDAAVLVQLLHGQPVVTFHGSVEWALDSVQLADAVWLPSETQVRQFVEQRLDERNSPDLLLQREAGGYVCAIAIEGQQRFRADSASDAYAQALLFLLERERTIVAAA